MSDPQPGSRNSESVLVTGCSGFIGWKVCEFLLADGYTVVGVDNLNEPCCSRWRPAIGRGPVGIFSNQRHRHIELAGVVPRVRGEEVRAGFHLQSL